MPTVTLAPITKQQFFDASGAPLAGGLVYTFEAGTSTPLATYADSTGTTPNTNPIVLDSAGRAGIWLSVAQPYKIEVRNAAGVVQYTTDNVDLSIYADSSIGADALADGAVTAPKLASADAEAEAFTGVIKAKYAGAGAAYRTLQDWLRADPINVLNYGAKGDDTTDDTSAFQDAIDQINSSYLGGTWGGGAGVLYCPPGRYKLSGLILKKGVSIIGAGSAQTVFLNHIDGSTLLSNPSKTSQVAADVLSQCSIDGVGFGIHSSLTPSVTTRLLDSTGFTKCSFKDLFFTVPSNVIGLDNSDNNPAGSGGPASWYNEWYSIHFYCTGGIGARFGTDSFTYEQVTDQKFFGGSVKGTSGIGMHLRAATGFNFFGMTFEGLSSGSNNTLIIGDSGVRTSTSNNLHGCYLEQARIIYKTNTNRNKRWGTFETTVSVTDSGTRNGRVDEEQLYTGWPKAVATARVVGGASPSISRGFNVASVVRSGGTGIYDITFTSALASINYIAIAQAESSDAIARISTKTTAAVRVVFESRAGVAVDPTNFVVAIFDHP